MSINKVIVNDEVKLDLSKDTATASNVEKGFTFHDANGDLITGDMKKIETVEEAITQFGDGVTAYFTNASGSIDKQQNKGVIYKQNDSEHWSKTSGELSQGEELSKVLNIVAPSPILAYASSSWKWGDYWKATSKNGVYVTGEHKDQVMPFDTPEELLNQAYTESDVVLYKSNNDWNKTTSTEAIVPIINIANPNEDKFVYSGSMGYQVVEKGIENAADALQYISNSTEQMYYYDKNEDKYKASTDSSKFLGTPIENFKVLKNDSGSWTEMAKASEVSTDTIAQVASYLSSNALLNSGNNGDGVVIYVDANTKTWSYNSSMNVLDNVAGGSKNNIFYWGSKDGSPDYWQYTTNVGDLLPAPEYDETLLIYKANHDNSSWEKLTEPYNSYSYEAMEACKDALNIVSQPSQWDVDEGTKKDGLTIFYINDGMWTYNGSMQVLTSISENTQSLWYFDDDSHTWGEATPAKYYEILKLITDNSIVNLETTLNNLKTNYSDRFNTLLTTIKSVAGEN